MLAKLGLAAAILTYLVVQARGGFSKLVEEPPNWWLLAAATACTFTACTLSFMRWHLLIRAVGIEARLIDSVRLGALGLALNFVSPGAIGGDFFKAVFLAHGQPGRRTEAVSTVVADRVLGLLTMLLWASVGILSTRLAMASEVPVRVLCRTILITTAVCWTGAGLLLFVPALSGPTVSRWCESIPLVGQIAARLMGAVRTYRSRKLMLLAAFCISVVMALFYVTSYYTVARALPVHEPTWREHLVIVPTAGLIGALPITFSGVGTTELAVEELYKNMPGGDRAQKGDGTLVALTRRVTEIAVALVGLIFYFTHRKRVREVFEEAEEAADSE
jgi:glycosyltransferase 2 family protein